MNSCKYCLILVLFNIDGFIIRGQLVEHSISPVLDELYESSESNNFAPIKQNVNVRNNKTNQQKCNCRDSLSDEKNDNQCNNKAATCSMCIVCFKELHNKTQSMKLKSKSLLYNNDLMYSQLSIGSKKRGIVSVFDELDKIELQINKRMTKDNHFHLENRHREHDAIERLETIQGTIADYETNINKLMDRIHVINMTLDDFRKKNHLLLGDHNLNNNKLNSSDLHSFSFEEASESLSTSLTMSNESLLETKDFKTHLLASQNRHQKTENILSNIENYSTSSSLLNDTSFDRFTEQVSKLESDVQENTKCGASTMASQALNMATESIVSVSSKYMMLGTMLRELNDFLNATKLTHKSSIDAFKHCQTCQSYSHDAYEDMKRTMLSGIYVEDYHSMPSQVKLMADECLSLQTTLMEDIPEVVVNVKTATSELTQRVTRISLENASNNAQLTQSLSRQAGTIQQIADDFLNKCVNFSSGIEQIVSDEQSKVYKHYNSHQQLIDIVKEDIPNDMIIVESDKSLSTVSIKNSHEIVLGLQRDIYSIERLNEKNELYASQANKIVQDAFRLTDDTFNGTINDISDKIIITEKSLISKVHRNAGIEDRVAKLRADVHQIATEILAGISRQRELSKTLDEYEIRQREYIYTVYDLDSKLSRYGFNIDSKAQHYRECQP